PNASPPHKDNSELLNPEQRYHMVELAIKNNPALELSAREMNRTGFSYTIDTVNYYRVRFPGTEIYFITGADSLYYMETWRDIELLVERCIFIVATRPGYSIDRNDPALARLPANLWHTMKELQIPGLDISSSDIRNRVAHGKPIKYLLPSEVEEYILAKGLYRKDGKRDVE
ncbi:MAG: nicotinate-nucleotide adenylyltransferase, partial [Syntrophomonas sp.]